MRKVKLGWIRQPRDSRDHVFAGPRHGKLAEFVDLRSKMPPVWNQGKIGSCTAHGVLAVAAECQITMGKNWLSLSRLQTYYDARQLSGLSAYDEGAYIRAAIKALAKYGAAPESLWPYEESKVFVAPGPEVYESAEKFQALRYQSVTPTVSGLRAALSLGYSVTFGFDVPENFLSITTNGIMPKPSGGNEGGHCVVAVGFAEEPQNNIPAQHFIIRNSWGVEWGDQGYFYMPYTALRACDADDGWTITSMESGE